VVVSAGNRYSPAGLVMGLACIVTGGRGLFGNFQESGLQSANVMIIMTVLTLALSMWATYEIKQSYDLVTKRITTPHMCISISDTYNSCDELNTAYTYLTWPPSLPQTICELPSIRCLRTNELLRHASAPAAMRTISASDDESEPHMIQPLTNRSLPHFQTSAANTTHTLATADTAHTQGCMHVCMYV